MRFLALCLISLIFVLPLVAQEDVPSPSGEIVFTSNREGGVWQIYVMNVDGSNVRQLTHTEHPAYVPIWSPDGKKIAFIQDLMKNTEYVRMASLRVMDADGKNSVEIARDRYKNFVGDTSRLLSWSPDSKRLIYSRFNDRDKSLELILVNADGTESQNLTSSVGEYSQSYFLTNETLVLQKDFDVHDDNDKGPNVFQYNIADGLLTPLAEEISLINPSPDGTQIAFFKGLSLLVMDVSTGEQRLLHETLAGVLPGEYGNWVSSIGWSADGSHIGGVIGTSSPSRSLSPDVVFVTSTDGMHYVAFETSEPTASLSPDGEYVVYSVEDDSAIMIARTDGEDTPKPIAIEGRSAQPAWRPIP